MKIEQVRIRDLVQLGPLPNATLHQLIDELDARATIMEMGGPTTQEAARHARMAIDELRIVATMCQAMVDKNATAAS